jgi:uncharacterized heparinase superfamily protein
MQSFKNLFKIAINYILFKHRINFNMEAILNRKYNSVLIKFLYKADYNLLHNELFVNGKKHPIKNFDTINNFDENIQQYILSCEWVLGLRNINTLQSYHKTNSLLSSLLSKSAYHSNKLNDLEIIAKRVSNLLLCNDFFNQFEHKNFTNLIKNTLIKDIAILLKSYNTKEYKLKIEDFLYFYKALLLISLSDTAVIVTDILEDINKNLEAIFLNDGGHKSGNISISFYYLKELSIIKDILKNEPFDFSILFQYVDKLSLFIKILRHSNNTLAIFNGSQEFEIDEINLLLSNHNTPLTSNYNTLPNSGYMNLKSGNNNFIMSYLNNQNDCILSFEASINKEKIITNLGQKHIDINTANSNNSAIAGKLKHSGLILIINNQIIKFNNNNKNSNIKRREEDNWYIVEASQVIEDFGITYHKIIYLSRNNKHNYILGEDLISFANKNTFSKVQRAFLRFNIHPNINQIESLDKNKVVVLHSNKNKYYFSSPDEPIKFSTNPYLGRNLEHEFCNTFDINFNLNKPIIKLEWSLCDNILNKH